MAIQAPSKGSVKRRDPKTGKRRVIGETFYCQNCGKTYIKCQCEVYQSAYAKGRTTY